MIFKGKAKEGKMYLKYPNEFREYLLEREGKEIVVVVDKYEESKRTKYQNNYYWAIIRQIVKRFIDIGYDTNIQRTHEYFASVLLTEYREVPKELTNTRLLKGDASYVKVNGRQMIPTVRSTSSLTKEEFGEYLDTIIRYCAEHLELEIPSSEEWFT